MHVMASGHATHREVARYAQNALSFMLTCCLKVDHSVMLRIRQLCCICVERGSALAPPHHAVPLASIGAVLEGAVHQVRLYALHL